MSAAEDLLKMDQRGEPAPECIAFVSDNQTHGVVRTVLDDIFDDVLVRDGSTAQVIEYLSESSPPQVLIVDLSDTASPLTAIMSLTAALPEATKIIGVGSINDITLYREIIDAGATDYVVKPVTEKALATALKRVNETPSGTGPAADNSVDRKQQRIAVIGSRGGVGVTTVATNLAWLYSDELKHKTILVDLDLEFGTIALSLDLEPTRGLREALENPSRIDGLFISSATAKLSDNLSVMATEETLAEDLRFNPNAVDVLFETLGRSTDTIVIDVPRSAFSVRQKVFEAATQVIIVTELNLPGLRDSIRLLANLEDAAPKTPVLMAVNRAGGLGQAMPLSEFQKALGRKIDFQIPEDPKTLNRAANNGKPLVQQDKRCKTSKAFEKIAKQLDDGNKKHVKGGVGADDAPTAGKKGALAGLFSRK